MMRNGKELKPLPAAKQTDYEVPGQDRLDDIGQQFLTMWQQAHGTPGGTVSVTTWPDGLMILVENAFCQAELALAQQGTDNLLQQYIDHLADQTLPMLISQTEAVIGRSVQDTKITSNIEQDWLLVSLVIDLSPATGTNVQSEMRQSV